MYQNFGSMSDKELIRFLVKEARTSSIARFLEEKSLPQLMYDSSAEELIQIEGFVL